MNVLALLFVLGMALQSSTAAPASGPRLDAATARALIASCEQRAAARGQSHSIVVVDAGGGLIAALRMDRSSPGTIDFALEKARASAAWGFSTAQMARAATTTPGFARAPHVVTVEGGLPIYSADGSLRLGGAAASGEAPADDASCIEAGIASVGLVTRR